MRIGFIACLLACLVPPVGAESPYDRLSDEEVKAIAKEIVDNIRARLDRQRKNRGDAESLPEREDDDECAINAWLGTGIDPSPEYFSRRTDHLKPCPPMWKVQELKWGNSRQWFISAEGYPHGEVGLGCYDRDPSGRKWILSFKFKDYWGYQQHNANFRKPRNKKEQVHLQLGFWSQVKAAEEGEGFTLKQTTLDFKSKRISDHEVLHYVDFLNKEAIDLTRKIYHSEAFSWIDLRTGETNTVLVGETIRPSIAKLMSHCGLDPDSASSSPRQSSQR